MEDEPTWEEDSEDSENDDYSKIYREKEQKNYLQHSILEEHSKKNVVSTHCQFFYAPWLWLQLRKCNDIRKVLITPESRFRFKNKFNL